MVCKLENLFKTLYAYFNKNSLKHLEFNKLIKILKNQSNKLMKNVKIRWVSILELTKRKMNEYCILVVKMVLDCACNNFANVNFKFLCDIEVLDGSIVLLALLEEMNNLMKLSQVHDVFVVNYVARIKFVR
jgi:hypothetical protein